MITSPKVPAARVRELISGVLDARRGKNPVPVSAIIGQVRSVFPDQRINDAELTHLIAEGAIRRGLDVDFDGGVEGAPLRVG